MAKENIIRMLERYEKNVTVDSVMNSNKARKRAEDTTDSPRNHNTVDGYVRRATNSDHDAYRTENESFSPQKVFENKSKRQRCDPYESEPFNRPSTFNPVRERRNLRGRTRPKFVGFHGRRSPDVTDIWRPSGRENQTDGHSGTIDNEMTDILGSSGYSREEPKAQRMKRSRKRDQEQCEIEDAEPLVSHYWPYDLNHY